MSGPKLRGRDLDTNNPEGGPPLDENGNPLAFGVHNPPPDYDPGVQLGPDGRPLPYGFTALEGRGPDLNALPQGSNARNHHLIYDIRME